MPRLPQVRPRRLIKALERFGFQAVRQKGSHVQLKNGNLLVTVPIHSGTLNPETLKSILRQAKLDIAQVLRKL